MANKPTYDELDQKVNALEKEALKLKHAEDELRESEERYRHLFENESDAVMIFDAETLQFEDANQATLDLYGYSKEEFLTLTVEDISAEKERTRIGVQKVKDEDPGSKQVPLRYLRKKNGVIFPGEIYAGTFISRGRKKIIGVARDITRRKQTEEALRESEAQKRAILDASIDQIRYVNGDMRIIWANKTTASALDMSPEDLVGRPCYELFLGNDSPCEGCPTVRARETGQTERAVMTQRQPKGVEEESYWDTYCVPLKNEAGKIEGFLQIARNVTHQKLAEEHIHILTQQLMKAQESERQRISLDLHDNLAQELSTLKIGLDTLLDNEPGASPEKRQRISELSKTLQRTIMGVRDLAYDLRPPSLDQLGLVRTVFQYCEDFSEKSAVTVDFYSAGMDDLKLGFDTEINLYRLIQEALNNIKKHADAGRVTINLVASSPSIILRIEDDGKGFDMKDQLVTAMTEKRMGLRSMEERVSLLQGKMRIQSRPMQGTRIFIEVPYKEK